MGLKITTIIFTFQIDDIAQTGDTLVDIETTDGDNTSSDSDSSSDSDAEVQELEAINVGEGMFRNQIMRITQA